MLMSYSSFLSGVIHSNFWGLHLRSNIIWCSCQPLHSRNQQKLGGTEPKNWLAISWKIVKIHCWRTLADFFQPQRWAVCNAKDCLLYMFCSWFWSSTIDFTQKMVDPATVDSADSSSSPCWVLSKAKKKMLPTFFQHDWSGILTIMLVDHNEVGNVCLVLHYGSLTSPKLLVNLPVVIEIQQFSQVNFPVFLCEKS